MSAAEILRQWTAAVNDLLPQSHAHQRKALAAMSLGMALCGRCDSGELSVALPLAVKPASVRRRMERLVSNPRLRPAQVACQLARSILSNWSGATLMLILDETPGRGDLRCMKISVGFSKRAVPLAWECYPAQQPPEPMPKLIWHLMRRVARGLPPGATVTLLADRGLAWPSVVDGCKALGWHYVLRLQGSTRIRCNDQEQVLGELVDRGGRPWFGRNVELFKKAGWRRANVLAVWERRCKERWLLVTDLPASYARCRGYCKRMWAEQMHRDEKSHGLHFRQSQVTRPSHVGRLLLLMALAMLLCLSIGTWTLRRGLRKILESTRQRRLSVFQLGIRWLRHAALVHQPMPLAITLPPP